MTSTNEAGAAEAPTPLPFAGFWRRVGAFVVDALLLGCAGAVLGWLAFDAFAALGGWGRAVGFALAWPYLGLMNSRLAGGQTLGKRLLGLRTVAVDGSLLSPARSLLRGLVLALPWFLNGAVADPDLLRWLPLLMLLSLIVFGVGLGLAYLLVFNRPSRRSLHDWAAGSVVVREPLTASLPPDAALWRGHLAVLGLLALATLALPVWLHGQMGSGDAAEMLAMRATAVGQPGVRQAAVTKGWTAASSTRGSGRSTFLAVQAWAGAAQVRDDALCDQIARALIERHPAEVGGVDGLAVSVVYGYDIGIASAWYSRRVTLPLAQWRERLR